MYRALFAEAIDSANLNSFGAFHGADLLFYFDNLDVAGYEPTVDERELRDTLQGQLRGLTTSGDPNSGAQPVWTRYDATEDNYLTLESGGVRMQSGLRSARCDFWERIQPTS